MNPQTLKEYIVVQTLHGQPSIWRTGNFLSARNAKPQAYAGYKILSTFNYNDELKDSPYQGSAADYEEVLKDHDRLVREIDVILNGEEGAAKQASLCDLVGQIKELKEVLVAAAVKRLMDDSAASPAGDGWNLNMDEAPKDGTPIQAWHKLWECPISVKWVGDKIQHEKFPWVCVTLANTWPEEAFTAWRPLPSPPNTSV